MKRASFKVLLGPPGTPLDRFLEAMARRYMEDRIGELPGDSAVVRELSVLLGMEPSRVRRLLNDLEVEF